MIFSVAPKHVIPFADVQESHGFIFNDNVFYIAIKFTTRPFNFMIFWCRPDQSLMAVYPDEIWEHFPIDVKPNPSNMPRLGIVGEACRLWAGSKIDMPVHEFLNLVFHD